MAGIRLDLPGSGGELEGLGPLTVVNPNWERGIGCSIRIGITALTAAAPGLDAVLRTLCDQALIEHHHLNRLIEAFSASYPSIASSRYGDAFGAPALFHRSLFGELVRLADDEGAKRIIRRHIRSTLFVDMPEAGVDIDTVEDYARLTRPSNGRRPENLDPPRK